MCLASGHTAMVYPAITGRDTPVISLCPAEQYKPHWPQMDRAVFLQVLQEVSKMAETLAQHRETVSLQFPVVNSRSVLISSRHDTLNQRRFNVGPTSETAVQH